MKTLLAFLAAISISLPQPASALAISTGGDLANACNAVERFDECVSYLKAVHDTAKAIARMGATEPRRVVGSCGPDKGIDTVPLTIALRAAWREYAEDHPARLAKAAAGEVLLAFDTEWPCRSR